jgi:G3E family GTPase
MMPAIPLVVIGGYLGAGKTTLLNHLLTQAGGRHIAVLVNDFGSINIDAALIREHTGDVINLENGCICCSIGGRLVEALLAVGARADPPDLLVIEASGVSDPVRIAQIGLLDRGFRLHGIAVLVDVERIGETLADPYVCDIARRQITGATALVLNKTDLVDEPRQAAVQAMLTGLASTVIMLPTTHGAVPLALLLDLQAAPRGRSDALALAGWAATQLPAGIRSFTFSTESRFDRGRLKDALRSLSARLLRAKGFVRVEGEDAPQELHVVGSRILIGPCGAAVSTESTIVLIGLFQGEHERQAIRALEAAMSGQA